MVLKQKNEKIFSPKFPTYLVNLTKFINNDDYSLDASKNPNRGKRTVDSKDNSCREGSKVPNNVVDLTTHPEQSTTGNESILNSVAVTNMVSHQLLQDVFNMCQMIMQKGECGNSVKTTQSATTALLPNQAVKLVKE